MKDYSLAVELLSTFQKVIKLSRESNDVIARFNIAELKLCMILNQFEKKGKEISPIELSTLLHMSPPAINKLLNSLECKNTIKRYRKDDNRKLVYVKLSDEALHFVEQERRKIIEYLMLIIEKMGEENIKQLISLIEKLSDIITHQNKGDAHVTT